MYLWKPVLHLHSFSEDLYLHWQQHLFGTMVEPMRYYDDDYPPYVPVAERRAKAEKKLQQMRKKQPGIQPVIIAGNALATTWWGKSWNSNLKRYADYSNRIGRGRSYVRNRAVLDLALSIYP